MNAIPDSQPPVHVPAYYLGRSARVWLAALRPPTTPVVVLDRSEFPPDGISGPAFRTLSGIRVATGRSHGGDEPARAAMLSAVSFSSSERNFDNDRHT